MFVNIPDKGEPFDQTETARGMGWPSRSDSTKSLVAPPDLKDGFYDKDHQKICEMFGSDNIIISRNASSGFYF